LVLCVRMFPFGNEDTTIDVTIIRSKKLQKERKWKTSVQVVGRHASRLVGRHAGMLVGRQAGR
jgi:hypothetical protein